MPPKKSTAKSSSRAPAKTPAKSPAVAKTSAKPGASVKPPANVSAPTKEVLTSEEAQEQVKALGYCVYYTWKDFPRQHYPAHTHSGKTTHLIISGSLEYCYPDDGPERHKCGPGDRWDVEANKAHEVWIGSEGATYVIGE